MEKRERIIKEIQKTAAQILPEESTLSLYGSLARGDYNENSDWDLQILIPGEEKVKRNLWDKYAYPFTDVCLEFDEIIMPRLYSYSGWKKRSFLPLKKK